MSLIVAGLLLAGAGGAALVTRWLGRGKGEGAAGTQQGAAGAPAARDVRSGPGPWPGATTGSDERGAVDHLAGFPCQLGDVVTRLTGEEAWLAGGVVLSEELPVAVLFVAPDAGRDVALYVRPSPSRALFWMAPLDPGEILVGGEPPTSVEHGRVRFERVRRLPLAPRRVGVGAPDVGDGVVVAEYASSGDERLVVVKTNLGAAFAYRGLALDPSAYEVIASGRSTLD